MLFLKWSDFFLLQGPLSSVSSSHARLVLPNSKGLHCFRFQFHTRSLITRRALWIPSTLFSCAFFFFLPCIARAPKLPRPLQPALSKRSYRLIPTCTTLWDAQIRLSGNKSPSSSFLEDLFWPCRHAFQQKWQFLKKYFGRKLTMVSTHTHPLRRTFPCCSVL